MTDSRAALRDLMDDVDQYSVNRDVWERARAALAQPEPALPQRPECFEFALDFLGSPENDQLREYIERLEARAALALPVAEGPTDNDILACMIEAARSVADGQAIGIADWHCEAIAAARAVLARYGHQPAPPAAVAPGPSMEDVGPLIAWLTEQAHQAADASQPADAGMLTWAAQVIGERVDEDAPAPVTDSTDEQLLATIDAVSVILPPLPMDHTDAHGRIEYDIAWRIAMARAVLARWGGQAAPVPVSERLPGASHVYFEFVVSDADYCTQAGGIAPTYAQALSEGQHYLAQYQQEDPECGPHTLELRRVEVLNPGALPLPAGEVQP